MKTSFLRILAAATSVAILLIIPPAFGADYLIIKKKDGTTQKVPLKFPAGQIQDFDVESAPEGQVPAPGRPTAEPEELAPSQEAQQPGAPRGPGGSEIEAERPSKQPPFLIERKPSRLQQGPQPGISPRGRGKGPAGPKRTEAQPEPAMRPLKGPVMAAEPGGKGVFTVNVYKLPDNVAALPDFSAFRPKQVLSTDRINLDPAKGDDEPAGLQQDTTGIGMRFVGMFLVAGEGIFKWRLLAKDGARMHIDDKTLIELDGIHEPLSKSGFVHLAEGVHSIIVDSFNSKGAPVLKLFVQPPLGPEQVFSIGPGVAGWKEPDKPYDVLWAQVYFVPAGKYPKGPDFNRISPVGRIIAPDLSINEEGFPGLPGRSDMVAMRYQGFFSVSGAGIFAFRLVTDNYAKLSIGDDSIVEVTDGSKAGAKGELGWAFLQDGSYPISVEYFHARGKPRLELFVTQPEKEEELFAPSRALAGFPSDSGKLSLIPGFVYFLKSGAKKLPNFNKMSPAGMFFTKAIDYPVDRGTQFFPGVPQRDKWFGLRFYVKFSLTDEEKGAYKFRVVCRDGARLIIGKKVVINADGVGKTQNTSGTADLSAGSHEMFLDYFQTTGPNGLQLFITPPGGQEKVFAFN